MEKFPSQLKFEPEIINIGKLAPKKFMVVGGMGGSHLSASLIKDESRLHNLSVFSDYGLPKMDEDIKRQTLFVAISHSGNTEETLAFAEEAIRENLSLAVITKGGKIKKLAEKNNLPFIILPDDDFPPRLSTGYIAVAIFAIFGMTEKIAELKKISEKLAGEAKNTENEATRIAKDMTGKIPLVYSSLDNYSLGYYWKIALNETAKEPAFANVFPELNHNELSGFTENNSAKPYFLTTIEDSEDHPQVIKRMNLTEKILAEKGAKTLRIKLSGGNRLEKYWNFVFLTANMSFALAEIRKVDPASTALIEKFKKELD